MKRLTLILLIVAATAWIASGADIILSGNANFTTCKGGGLPDASDSVYLNGYQLTIDSNSIQCVRIAAGKDANCILYPADPNFWTDANIVVSVPAWTTFHGTDLRAGLSNLISIPSGTVGLHDTGIIQGGCGATSRGFYKATSSVATITGKAAIGGSGAGSEAVYVASTSSPVIEFVDVYTGSACDGIRCTNGTVASVTVDGNTVGTSVGNAAVYISTGGTATVSGAKSLAVGSLAVLATGTSACTINVKSVDTSGAGYPIGIGKNTTVNMDPNAALVVSNAVDSSKLVYYSSLMNVGPGEANVLAGTAYKINGVAKTGTLAVAEANKVLVAAGGTATYPPDSFVLAGYGAYGIGGDSNTGSATGGDPNYETTAIGGLVVEANVWDVRRGVAIGKNGTLTGQLVAASPVSIPLTPLPDSNVPPTTLTANVWTGTGAEDGNSWDTAALWSLGHLPTVTEIAVVDQAATYKCLRGLDSNGWVGGLRINSAAASEPNWGMLHIVSRFEANEATRDMTLFGAKSNDANGWSGSVIVWTPTYDSNQYLTLCDTRGATAATLYMRLGYSYGGSGNPYDNGKHLRGQFTGGRIIATLATGAADSPDDNIWFEGRFSGTVYVFDGNANGYAGSCIGLHAEASRYGGIDGNITGLSVVTSGQYYEGFYEPWFDDGTWDSVDARGPIGVFGGRIKKLYWRPPDPNMGGFMHGLCANLGDDTLARKTMVDELYLWGTCYVGPVAIDGLDTSYLQSLDSPYDPNSTVTIGAVYPRARNASLVTTRHDCWQKLTITATGGTLTLTCTTPAGKLVTTGPIAADQSDANIATAINTALGSTAVTVQTVVADKLVRFNGVGYTEQYQPLMTVDGALLTGGTATCTYLVYQKGGSSVRTIIGNAAASEMPAGGGGGPIHFP